MIFLKNSSPAAWNFSSLPNIVLMFLEDPLKMLYVNRMEIKHLDTYMRLLKDICARTIKVSQLSPSHSLLRYHKSKSKGKFLSKTKQFPLSQREQGNCFSPVPSFCHCFTPRSSGIAWCCRRLQLWGNPSFWPDKPQKGAHGSQGGNLSDEKTKYFYKDHVQMIGNYNALDIDS